MFDNSSKSVNLFALTLLLSLPSACSTPFLTFPGGKLEGVEAKADSWAFAREFTLLQLETKPENPYSVYLIAVIKNDQLFVNSAGKRKWHGHVKEDPHVRVKLGAYLYHALALEVTDPETLKLFVKGRHVYRLNLL